MMRVICRFKILAIIVLTFFVMSSKGQIYQVMPQYGYKFNRVAVDSTLHIPSYCGVPSITDYIKNGMIAIDTCNNVLFQWTRVNGWTPISTGTYLDTNSLSNRINQRVKYTDTASMLNPYLRKIDTTAMLSKYLRKSDTTSLSNRINLKLNISDTSTMLSKYLRIFDTTSMLSKYLRKSDTTAMLSPYVRKVTTITPTAPLTGGGDLSANRTISIPQATSSVSGYLNSTDFTYFNAKVDPTTGVFTTLPLQGGGNFFTNRILSIRKANINDSGYLSATDYNRFSNKVDTIYRTLAKDSIQFYINGRYYAIKDSAGGSGTVTRAVDTIYRTSGKDSIIFTINGTRYAIKDSVGSGGGGGSVTAVTASAPLSSSGGTTPNITMPAAGNSQNGYLTSTNFVEFSNKVASVGGSGIITSTGGYNPVISSSVNANKLVGRNPTTAGEMEEITIGSGLSLSGTTLSSTSGVIASAAFGSFFDSTTQTITSTTTAYPIKITKTDTAKGFHISNNKIIADSAGVYNFQWSGQFQNTDNAEQDVTVWIRKNGVNVVGSTGFISVPKTHGGGAGTPGHMIASWNYIIPMNIGDSIVWYWQANNTSVSLKYYAQQTSPTRPSTASVIVTVTPASGAISGGGSQNLQQVLNNGYTLNGNFYFQTNTSDSVVNLSGTRLTAPRTYQFPDSSGILALKEDLLTKHYQIDLSASNYTITNYGVYEIKIATDSTTPYYIIFPNATLFTGQRITLINADASGYNNNAIIDTTGEANTRPKYQGTYKTIGQIPYGMTYEFISTNGVWMSTNPMPAHTQRLDIDNNLYETTIPFGGIYKIYNGDPGKEDDYYIIKLSDPKKNNGERITLINTDTTYSLKIQGTWIPVSKNTYGGQIVRVPPQSTYEFVSIDSQWVCVNMSTPPTYINIDLTAADFNIPSCGVYFFSITSTTYGTVLPTNAEWYDGRQIILINNDGTNDLLLTNAVNPNGTSYTSLPAGSARTLVSINGKWVVIR